MSFGVLGGRALRVCATLALSCAMAACLAPAASAEDVFSGELADSSLSPTAAATGASISSDKADYGPGEMVYLSGAGWQPGESVHIVVDDDGLQAQSWQRDTTVTADADGNISDEFELAYWFVANYTVTATGEQSGIATTAFTDTINATASVDRTTAFRGRSAVVFNFTIVNTADANASSDQGRRIRIAAPTGLTFTSCSTTRTNWTGGASPTECLLSSSTNPLPQGASASVTVTANVAAGDDSLANSWVVRLGPNEANNGGQVVATPTPGGNLGLDLYAFEVTDAVISTSTAAAGTACPAANTTAPAGSSRFVIVCGRTGVSATVGATVTPVAAQSSLAGTMIGTAGTFTSGAVAANSASPIVLAVYNATTITASAGTGKTVLSKIGSAATRTSPSTTLNGYEATNACTAPAVTTQPGNQSITYGANASFTSASSGTAPVSVQWQRSTNGGGSFTDISGENSGTLSFTKPPVSRSGDQYRAVFTNACGSATSSAATLTVAAKSVTGSFTVPAAKVYDRTAAATISTRALSGAVSGDDVSLSGGTASYNNTTVGTGKTVTGSGFTLAGADAPNYTLASVSTTTADITAKQVTGSFTASNKPYDGNTDATITGRSLSGAIAEDDVSLTGGTASFGTKNVGTGKTVNGTGFSLAGADKDNYSLASSSLSTTADITAKTVTGSFTADNKPYDGNTDATILTRSLSGDISSDDVDLDGGSAAFENRNAGTGKTVNGTGFGLSGDDAGNYSLESSSLTTTADITPRSINGHFTADDKDYDGTTDATIATRNVTGEVSGDDVDLTGGTAAFENRNAGTGKTVNGTGFSLSGDDKDNYQLASSSLTTTADITAKEVTGSFTAENKVYDGNTGATIATRSLAGAIEDDDVELSGGSASFGTRNVGDGKTVTGTGFTLDGDDAGNYELASSELTTTANVTAKDVAGQFTADDKPYDGTTAATIATRTLTGDITGDDVQLSGGTATFANKNVGTGKTVSGSGFSLSGDDAGNYHLTSSDLTTTASISALEVEGHFTAENKPYDGTTAATIATRTLTGAVEDDDVALTGGSATFADRNVANGKTVTGTGFSLGGADKDNYTLVSGELTATANITAKTVTGSFTADNKPYDGTRDATISDRSLDGAVPLDDVALSDGTATFDTKNVGEDKDVTGTGFGLTGTDAANYELASTELVTTANITKKTVTGSFTADDKTYDGTRDATILSRSLDGTITGDDVELTDGSATFDTKSAGADKEVSASGFTLGGDDAGNYELASSDLTTTASIDEKDVQGHFTADDKPYDGTTDATISHRSLTGTIDGDDVDLTGGTAAFENRNAGDDKTVNGSGFSLTGTDAPNYHLVSSDLETTADITAKQVTGSFTASNKDYDGNTDATIATRTLTGDITGDDVQLTGGTATFANRNAGTGKTVNGTGFALDGDDAGNYELASSELTTTADIAPKGLTGTFTAADKEYDGNADATITGSSLNPGVISGDDVSIDASEATASFDNRNVGDDKPVSGTGFKLTGDDRSNYALTSVADTTADITAKSVTGSFTADDKEYDGNTDATILTRSLSGDISGDDVHLAGGSAAFANKNVGTGKTVNGTGFTLTGDDKDNYSLASSSLTTTADIGPKTVTGSFTAHDKPYDGMDLATINERHLSGQIVTDDVHLIGGGATFNNRNAGDDKPVHATGFELDGDDKGNYTLASDELDTTADITPKELGGSFTAANKDYDGNTSATITGRSLDHPIAGDDVDLSGGSASFEDKNAGTGKTVNGTGFSLTGDDKDNYSLASSSLTTTANIAPKVIHSNFTVANKPYDGNRDATITGSSLPAGSVISGDDVSRDDSAATATFDNKNAGNGKTVTGSGFALSGADKNNYSRSMNTTTANITPKGLTGSFTADNKVYDGDASATITGRSLGTGVLSGDTVSLSGGSAAFNDENVGNGKPVTGSGFTLAGADRDNYSLGSVSGTTANITAKGITGSFTAADKIVDGTTSATITGRSLSGAISGDAVSLTGGTATFNNANPGVNKPVTGTGFSLAGADKDNYSLTSVANTTASILYAGGTASCLGSPGHSVLQPINTDGSSISKQGSTIPVKFRVCDAQGRSIGTPGVVTSFLLVGTSVGAPGAINEVPDSTNGDVGFRWSATDQQWIFNLSTKSLRAGLAYTYRISLNDGTFIDFRFTLK